MEEFGYVDIYLDRAFRDGQNDVLDRQKRSPDEWDTSVWSLEESGWTWLTGPEPGQAHWPNPPISAL